MESRRGFLRGLFGGVTAAGLIVTAKSSDIEAYATTLQNGSPLLLDRPVQKQSIVDCGEHLYNVRGELVAIVTELSAHRDQTMVNVTQFGDSLQSCVSGPIGLDIDIRAIGVGELQWQGQGFPVLRGRK